MISSGPLEEGHGDEGSTMEEYNYKCTKDLGYDI
jgi:hypothetical protein